MNVVLLHKTSALYEKVQTFAAKHKLTFHSAEWLANYGVSNIRQCIILNNNDELVGCFLYYEFKKALFRCLITPPFTPDIALFYINPGGSVVGKNSFTKEVMACVAEYFKKLDRPFMDITFSSEITDMQPFIWQGFKTGTRYSYLLDLMQSEEALWENLSSQKRKSINKATKDNIIVRRETDLKIVYPLIIKSLSRNGVAKNTDIIKRILFDYSGNTNSFAFVASANGKDIAASFCIIHNTRAIYLFGGFDSDDKHHGAGVSCMWQSILFAKKNGLLCFDFEGSMNEKIERYFREFGGELISYHSIQKIKPALKTLVALKGTKS